MLAYSAAIECLRAANQLEGKRLYSWHHLSSDGNSAVASNGVEIHCERDVDLTERFDYVFVCASDEALNFRRSATLDWLRSQARRGAVMGGISGGAFLLARAGLMKNRRLTLH